MIFIEDRGAGMDGWICRRNEGKQGIGDETLFCDLGLSMGRKKAKMAGGF